MDSSAAPRPAATLPSTGAAGSSSDAIIVLKFGGSVLQDEASLIRVAHEIYRWRREGRLVVAVVSALAGRTDALLAECDELRSSRTAAYAVAAHVRNGELACASRLGLLLERAGVDHAILCPSALRLFADGPALDAHPVRVDRRRIRGALAAHGVVVVPGYTGLTRDGRAVVFGRGGSDLTALFLAHALQPAACRLIKDVDGLYERDPGAPGPPPARFDVATWEDALATDGAILQHKAVRFARAQSVRFEVGRLNGARPTRIGPGPSRSGPPDAPVSLKVALLGAGVVGGGVADLLAAQGGFDIVAVAVRDPHKPREPAIAVKLLTTDPIRAATIGADIVVEAMGGVDDARSAVEAALRAGANVITANKALLAQHGDSLESLARRRGVTLLGAACVGGSTPILERAADPCGARIDSIEAILNGTTNYILSQMDLGATFEDALATAQRLGFAERDPARDLSGQDAADKLALLSRAAGLGPLAPSEIRMAPIAPHAVAQALRSARAGEVVRHIARLWKRPDGAAAGEVRLRAVPAISPLGAALDELNVAILRRRDGSEEIVRGRGAGRWPTAQAVLADVLHLTRGRSKAHPAPARASFPEERAYV